MKVLLILNPGSRAGRGRSLWTFWQERLHAAGVSCRAAVTERPEDALTFARDARDCDAVVAVGGDGTINRVLDGVLQSGRPDLRLGVLYRGTSPDFCRFHGIPVDPQRAIAALLAGRTRAVDALRVRYRDRSGQPLTAHVGCGLNVGLGAGVARLANRLRPFMGDRPGTGLAALWQVLARRAATVDIEVDGAALPLRQVTNLSVLKSPFIASGLRVALGLEPADGRLAVLAVPACGLLHRCRRLAGFYSGAIAHDPGVLRREGTRVSLRATGPQELEFDGDPRGWLPADIEVLPRAVHLIVPETPP